MNRILFYPHEKEMWLDSEESKNRTVLHIPMHDFRAQHISNIIKGRKDKVLLSGIVNQEFGEIQILDILADKIELVYYSDRDIDKTWNKFASRIEMHFCLAHTRPPVMSRVIKDLISMRVNSIDVFVSQLTEKNYMQSSMWKEKEKLALLGAMQGGFVHIPPIRTHYSSNSLFNVLEGQEHYSDAIKLICHDACKICIIDFLWDTLMEESVIDKSSKGITRDIRKNNIILAMGPERGFVEEELDFFIERGFVGVNLGKSILRSETATITIAGLLQMFQ